MRYYVTVGERTFEVDLSPDRVAIDGRPVRVDLARADGSGVRSLLVDGRSYLLLAARDAEGRWDLRVRGARFLAEAVDERTRAIREMTGKGPAHSGPRPVRASMPGLVVKVEVAEGEAVRAGQGAIVVEAMKMENELRCEADGVVARVHVAPGDTVEKDQVLIELAALGGEEDGG